MPRVVRHSASQAVKAGPSRRGVPLPRFVPPQLSQPVEKPPSGPQWLHEIKLDGYRMAARIDNGRVQLVTRTGLERHISKGVRASEVVPVLLDRHSYERQSEDGLVERRRAIAEHLVGARTADRYRRPKKFIPGHFDFDSRCEASLRRRRLAILFRHHPPSHPVPTTADVIAASLAQLIAPIASFGRAPIAIAMRQPCVLGDCSTARPILLDVVTWGR
jgi:hypothetical protein